MKQHPLSNMREHEAVIRSIIGSITEKHCSTIERKCAMSDKMKLTTNAGGPVVNNHNVMTAGPSGPHT